MDIITGHEDGLSALFYEFYRGYTIYSTEQGVCCIHGAGQQGCLRIRGKFVSSPDIEAAKYIIKYLAASISGEHGSLCAAGVFVRVNRYERQRSPTLLRSMQCVS